MFGEDYDADEEVYQWWDFEAAEPDYITYLDLYLDSYDSYDDFVSSYWEAFREAYGND